MSSKTIDHNLTSLSASIKPGTKVLFANVPADGHFNPLTGIAAHLKNIGCEVRWYTAVKYQKKIEKLGFPFYPLKRAMDVSSNENIDEVFPERKKYKGKVAKLNYDMINVFILRSPEYYEDIKEIHQEFAFEVMVADVAFGAIPFVRERMGIPVVSASVFPLMETSKDLAPNGLAMTPSYTFMGRRKQALLRFLADRVLFAKSTKVMSDILAQYGIDSENANIFDVMIRKSSIVLQSGTPSFEYKRSDIGRQIKFVGPLLPYTSKKEGPRWHPEKVKQYEKVILVTQGTVERDVEKIIVPTLEAFKNSDHLVVVTTGGSQTNDLRKRFPQENIIIEDFIPFDEVMPLADVYVTNGGYGGVLLSIQNELPMVAAGVHEGKNEICARIGYFKLGVNLKTEKPSPEQIVKGVEEVLNNPVYNKNIQKLNKEFKTYDPNKISTELIASVLKTTKEHVKIISLDKEEVY